MPLYTGRVTQGDRKPDPGGLVGRWPLVFCGLVVVGLVALTYISRLLVPSFVVGDVGDLDPASLEPPTPLEASITALGTSDNVFWALAAILALLLIPRLFSFREAGLTRPGRRLYLVVFPLLVAAL